MDKCEMTRKRTELILPKLWFSWSTYSPSRESRAWCQGSIYAKECSSDCLLCLCLHPHRLAMLHKPLPGFPAAAGSLLVQERCCGGWKVDLNKAFTLGYTWIRVFVRETALLKCCHENTWEKEVVSLIEFTSAECRKYKYSHKQDKAVHGSSWC